MSETKIDLHLPLDEDDFFRRECPFCRREFKVLLEKEELIDITQKDKDSFMIETKEDAEDLDVIDDSETECTCPYCGQQANRDSWWTQEQLAYIGIIANNIMAKLVNDKLIRPLKRTSQRHRHDMFSIQIECDEMKQQEPWISPEVNDMKTFNLPCCKRKIKIEDDWNNVVHCFFCGFPHESR